MARLKRKQKSKKKLIAIILTVETLITAFALGTMFGYGIELKNIEKVIISSKEIPSYLKQQLTNYKINYLRGE